MIESSNTWNERIIKSFCEIPLEYIKSLTSKFVFDTLDFFDWINFLSLSNDDCKNICTKFRASWRNKRLEEYLNKMWVNICIHPNSPDSTSYVLELEDSLFIESDEHLFLKDIFSSNNQNKYLRSFTVWWKTKVVLQVEGSKYYFLEYSLINILNWWIELEYWVIKNNLGLADIIDFQRKHIHEVSWFKPVFIKNKLRLTVSINPVVYVEFDWETLWPPVEIRETYPMIWDIELGLSQTPTLH